LAGALRHHPAAREATYALADFFRNAHHIVFLTGAGISTDSGIPDFRSETGLYRTGWSEEVFDIRVFRRTPQLFYEFARQHLGHFRDASPNPGHRAIAELGAMPGREIVVVTQNIDGLHRAAGSRIVLALHGDLETMHCLECGARLPAERARGEIEAGRVPRHDCLDCGGLLKPDIVFFGELLPEHILRRADHAITKADLLVIAGTSLTVYPAASLPGARSPQCRLVILNQSPTALDPEADLVFHGSISAILRGAVRRLALRAPDEAPMG